MFRRIILALAGVSALGACTPAQIATLGGLGHTITPEAAVTLEALPDAPAVVGDSLLNVDGTLTEIPVELLSPVERFQLAVSRSPWASRPDLHSWLACVVRRESNFNPRAHNPRGVDNSYGYMQINMRGSLGPARLAAHGLASNEDLFDPETNLRVGWELFQAAGTSPWKATRGGC